VLLALSGCHEERRELPQLALDSLGIVGGGPSTRRAVIPFVGATFCTATLLAPNLVLTAKHCVTPLLPGPFNCDESGTRLLPEGAVAPDAGRFGDVVSLDEIEVGFDGASSFAPHAREVIVSPGGDFCASDLAVIVLDREVDDPVLAPVRLSAEPTTGEPLVAVGHGVVTGTDPSPILMERAVTVLAVGPAPKQGAADAVQPGFFAVSEAMCRGDSGSPALAQSGAVVGVANAISNPGVFSPDGSAEDCVGSLARGKYQSTRDQSEVIRRGFAAAAATLWEEGQPDPRVALGGFGDTCAVDHDCRSNVCIQARNDGSVCSQGCLGTECPDGFECAEVDDRKRCVNQVDEADGTTSGESEGCNAGAATPDRGAFGLIASLLVIAARSARRR